MALTAGIQLVSWYPHPEVVVVRSIPRYAPRHLGTMRRRTSYLEPVVYRNKAQSLLFCARTVPMPRSPACKVEMANSRGRPQRHLDQLRSR